MHARREKTQETKRKREGEREREGERLRSLQRKTDCICENISPNQDYLLCRCYFVVLIDFQLSKEYFACQMVSSIITYFCFKILLRFFFVSQNAIFAFHIVFFSFAFHDQNNSWYFVRKLLSLYERNRETERIRE